MASSTKDITKWASFQLSIPLLTRDSQFVSPSQFCHKQAKATTDLFNPKAKSTIPYRKLVTSGSP